MLTNALICLTSLVAWGEAAPSPQTPNVEYAARLYRIAVYDLFRLDRTEYNLRREIGDQMWQAYEKSEKSPELAAEALAWFETAKAATVSTTAIPPLPLFVDFDESVPVTTSAQEDKVRLGPVGADSALNVELPKDAEPTGPSRFFSQLINETFDVLLGPASPPKSKEEEIKAVLVSPGVAPPAPKP